MKYEQIRKLRKLLELTQAEFAFKLKVVEPTVRNWEREKGPQPSISGLRAIKELMTAEGVNEKELL